MNLAFPLCLFKSHVPSRNAMHHAHRHVVSKCRRCGTAIKMQGTDDWVRDTNPPAQVTLSHLR